jgi:hypothetical protein
MNEGYQICPRCNKQTLPKIRESSRVDAVACQNPEYKALIDRKELARRLNDAQIREWIKCRT